MPNSICVCSAASGPPLSVPQAGGGYRLAPRQQEGLGQLVAHRAIPHGGGDGAAALLGFHRALVRGLEAMEVVAMEFIVY